MKRLTERWTEEHGTLAGVVVCVHPSCGGKKCPARATCAGCQVSLRNERLAEYEDTEASPDECAAALAKQRYRPLETRTQPLDDAGKYTEYICPTCGCVWEEGEPQQAFCGNCGQRIHK